MERSKRLSKSIHELSRKFEEGGENHVSQPRLRCGEGGEGLRGTATSSKISKFSGLEDINSTHTVDISKPTKFSNQFRISTNERSSLHISSEDNAGSYQPTNKRQASGVKRKGNWTGGINGRKLKTRHVISDN